MVKGTPSMGKKIGVKHIRCRRCGRIAFHVQHGVCAACGFGKTKTMRKYGWLKKNFRRVRKLQKVKPKVGKFRKDKRKRK